MPTVGLLGITLVKVTRGGRRNYSRRGQTSRPKSPITDCGVFSAINSERLGNAHLSQGLGCYKWGKWVSGCGLGKSGVRAVCGKRKYPPPVNSTHAPPPPSRQNNKNL